MSTSFTSTKDALKAQRWFVVDATDKVVGRLATRIARVLRGKHKATFTPHVDSGDFVIVLNADKLRFTGNKLEDKVYRYHTGFIGSIKSKSAGVLAAEKPEQIIINAVQGMLPKTPLGKSQLRKLKVYRGTEHPHVAQQPEVLEVDQ